MASRKRIVAWLLLLTVASAAGALAVFLFTPAPLRIARRLLDQSLRSQGISVSFRRSGGSLVDGIELEDASLKSSAGWTLEARRVYFRLSVASMVVQRPILRDLVVESPRIVLPEGWRTKGRASAGGTASESSLPRLSVRRLRILDARITAPGLVPGEPRLSELRFESFEGSVFLRKTRMMVKGKLLGAQAMAPGMPPPVRVDGQLAWEKGRGLELDVLAAAAGSQVAVRGAPPRTRGGGELFVGKVRLAPLNLALLRPFWPEAPERVAKGKADVKLLRGRLEWSGRAEVGGVGDARTKGWIAELPEGLGIGGDLETGGLTIAGSGLLPVLEPLAPQISGRVSWKLALDKERHVRGTVEGALGPSNLARFDVQRVRFNLRIAPEEVVVSGEGDGPLAHAVSGEVRLHPDDSGWHATARAQSADIQSILQTLGLWVEPPKPFSLRDPWLQDVAVELSGSPAKVTVAGSGANNQGARLELQLAKGEEAPKLQWRFRCENLAPEACGLEVEGAVSGEASFAGSGPDRGSIEIHALASRIARISVEPFSGRLVLDGAGIRLAPVSLTTDLGSLEAKGAWTGSRLALEGGLKSVDASGLARWAGVEGMAGSLDASWSLEVGDAGWSLQTRFRSGGFKYGALSAAKIEGDLRWSEGEREGSLNLSAAEMAVNKVTLGEARVALSRRGGIVRGAGSSGLGEGRSVSVKVVGPASLGEGDMRLSQTHLQFMEGREFVQEGDAALAWDAKKVSLADLKLVRGAKSSDLSFSLGRSAAGAEGLPVSARFIAHGLPLSALPIPPSAGTVGGRVEADLAVSGTTSAPLLNGSAHVEEGVFRFANSDLEYKPITLELAAEGDRLKVTRAHFRSPEGGEGAAVGWIRFHGLLPGEFLLEGSGGDLPFVVGKEMVGRAQFYVKFHGTPSAPMVEGIAKVTKGRIELPGLSRLAPLPPSVRFRNVPKDSPLAPSPRDEGPEPQRHLKGRFQLDFEDVWVHSRLLLAQVEGSIVARLTAEGPLLEGSASVTEGRYLFMGKKFDLKDSKILFTGNPDNVPDLDVTAKYEVPDYEVTARLTGPPQRPVVALSSKPALDQSDVLAVIMFGKPLKDLEAGQRQNWTAAAVAVAAQYQASPLLESGNTGLANLEVGVDDATGGGTVGFSRYIGDRLVLEYRQVFGSLPEERLNLRYRMNRKWSVEVETSSVGSSGGDLVWERRY